MSQTEKQKTYCTDCLKTKGFGIAMPIIIISAIVTVLVATAELDSIWGFFIGGWALIFFLTIGSLIIGGYCLSKYCKINDEDYKEPFVIGLFMLFTTIGIVVSILIIITLPENVEYWFSENRNWNR